MRGILGSLAAIVSLAWLSGGASRPLPVGGAASAAPPADAAEAYTYALGAFRPEYDVPEPGSYSLPVIQRVHDHPLTDATGGETTLFALKKGRAAVVAFVYMSCSESAGCPLSLSVLHRLDAVLAADPALSSRVTLIAISFDPDRDTPERMKELRELHDPKSDWSFATTSGGAALVSLLADFDQTAAKLRTPSGRWSGLFRHVLKVFLLDEGNEVRNVYSTGFLNPELVLTDLRTLTIAAKP
jgi:cytochrome oxidase Cu insertion factor (SCO1/SenC/PrrC family)